MNKNKNTEKWLGYEKKVAWVSLIVSIVIVSIFMLTLIGGIYLLFNLDSFPLIKGTLTTTLIFTAKYIIPTILFVVLSCLISFAIKPIIEKWLLKKGAIHSDEKIVRDVKRPNNNKSVEREHNRTAYPLGRMSTHAVLGENKKTNEPFTLNMVTAHNVLIGGRTHSGKTAIIQTLLNTMVDGTSPKELGIGIISFKRYEYKHYEQLSHLVRDVVSEPEDTIELINDVANMIEGRKQLFESVQMGEQTIDEYNKWATDNKKYDLLRQIVIVIDEYPYLKSILENEGFGIEDTLVDIAKHGNQYGVYLIIASDQISTDIITTDMLKVFDTKIIREHEYNHVETVPIFLGIPTGRKRNDISPDGFMESTIPKPKGLESAFIRYDNKLTELIVHYSDIESQKILLSTLEYKYSHRRYQPKQKDLIINPLHENKKNSLLAEGYRSLDNR